MLSRSSGFEKSTMPKSFLLCPNKRRDLEVFIRGELNHNDNKQMNFLKADERGDDRSPSSENYHKTTHESSSPTSQVSWNSFSHVDKTHLTVPELTHKPVIYTPYLDEHQTHSLKKSNSVSPTQISPQPVPVHIKGTLTPFSKSSEVMKSEAMTHHNTRLRTTCEVQTPDPSICVDTDFNSYLNLKYRRTSFERNDHGKRSPEISESKKSIQEQDKDSTDNKVKDSVFISSQTNFHRPSTFGDLPSVSNPRPVASLFPFVYPPFEQRSRVDQETVSPVLVDANIPFTTYLQNLTKTLRESAARSFSESEKYERQTPRFKDDEEINNSCHRNDKHENELSDDSEAQEDKTRTSPKRKFYEVGEKANGGFGDVLEKKSPPKKGNNLHEPEEEISSFKPFSHSKNLPSLIVPQRRHSVMGIDTERLVGSFSAQVYSKSAHSLSPSVILNPNGALPFQYAHVHQHSLRIPSQVYPLSQPSHQQIQQQLHQRHQHVGQSVQFPGQQLFNKVFPNLNLSSSPRHQLTITSPLTGTVPTSGLESINGTMNGLFHPAFLGLGGMNMRRASIDKPPPVKKYKCDVCQKAFSRSNTLVTHKRIHTGDKPFKCEVCGRAFRQPGNLTRHRLTHTTHKPYVCHVCNKAFNRASNLNTHIRTHSTFRQFSCSVCPKSFHQKADLASHVFSHTGERPYKCDVCGRGFSHSNTLAAHKRTHTDQDMVTISGHYS